MKVTFYLESKKLKRFNWEDIKNDTVALAGTTGQAFRLIYNLQKKTEWEINLIDTASIPNYGNVKTFQCENFEQGIQIAKENKTDVLIFTLSPIFREEDLRIMKVANDANLKMIIWSKNQMHESYLKLFNELSSIKVIAGPSAVMMNWYRHKKAFKKMTFMHNALYFNHEPKNSILYNKKQFVYIGALTEDKGFHHLAKVWPNIIKKEPDASLLVIGSSKLYNINDKIGPLGITSERFEKNFIIPYLGKSLKDIDKKNVKFLGLQTSNQLSNHIASSLAGIVNPNWEISPETFCVSAIEIQSMSKPIIGGKVGGLIEVSQNNKTSLLIKNHQELETAILFFLRNPKKADEMGKNAKKYVLEKFDKNRITNEWIDLISKINESKLKKIPIKYNDSFIKTGIKEAIRNINRVLD
ncbi:glycosyltransferase family 4 protein [Maribacter sp. 1_2014MBL_MicDiv]|uniref:glycosyltransferase family 4 protein n=1 Tax=Maribacter sp. 1_2014MBL_MicDiv TaxID=1644130 RepID=UPI0008F499DB|nr:glycosyltransferase family 4 protein [Maribacter sp. 1_2014MBL_MicDiv]